MTAQPLELFDTAINAHSGETACGCDDWHLRYADGHRIPLELRRWCSPADPVDLEILERCTDPTLDVGCGPGRLVAALCDAGRTALGIDIAAAAVHLARSAGGTVSQQSVFDPVLDEGHWGTTLLIDGNIGIGGDPVSLLRRCREILAPNGQIVVELDPPGQASSSVLVRLESRRERSQWFDWAHVAADAIDEPAEQAGLRVVESWVRAGRWFACVRR